MGSYETKNKGDLRVRRTYKLLSQALLSLLLERSFEEIFVTDICERAMVHRTTFYKHFEDKYHLLDFCVQELIRTFEGDGTHLYSAETMKEYYMGLIRKSLEYMADNKELFLTGILRAGNNSVLPMLNLSVNNLIQTKLQENEKLGVYHKIPNPVIAQFYSGALISASIWWLENDTPISIDEMVHYISLLINEKSYTFTEDALPELI
ncbi:TetR family transcriptional regulator [Anoxybacterium hadale]|uniref:TetR family transcriptional regulator n=1 Tax=Anoxybacterium hadale TaxID=3408580 RepID=A0ACD1ADI1_9FIRM|nr:TetR family transcriptional regulator [Clostridiales bacterium]